MSKYPEKMKFRNGEIRDIPEIMKILNDAKEWLKSRGTEQWQLGYPNAQIILSDIRKGNSYVLEVDGKVVVTGALTYGQYQTYNQTIYDGKWLNESINYMSIGRLAVAGDVKHKGYSSIFMKCTEELCKARGLTSIRLDTYQENQIMRNYTLKAGFTYCGKVKLKWGTMVLGYQKLLEPQSKL